jgi:hypothetical protein
VSSYEISWLKDKVLRFEFESEDEFKKAELFFVRRINGCNN